MNFKIKKLPFLLSVVVVTAVLMVIYFIVPIFSHLDFKGNLKKIDGNILIVNGKFISKTETDFFDVKIIVNRDTTIHRIGLKIPVALGSFNADTLPREESQVDLTALEADARTAVLGMEIDMKRVFYRPGYFTAGSITYRVPVFAVPRQ